jgi:signal peptidase I
MAAEPGTDIDAQADDEAPFAGMPDESEPVGDTTQAADTAAVSAADASAVSAPASDAAPDDALEAEGSTAEEAEGSTADADKAEAVNGDDANADEAGDADEADDAEDAARGKRRKRGSFLRDLGVIVVVTLLVVILLKAFVVQVFSIPSGSMENTLLINDRILVSKIVYDFRPIERGDVVVFSGAGSWDPPTPPPANWFVGLMQDAENLVGIAGPSTDYVKRVIGVPGDHVVCCNANGQVTVNGVPLSESSYIYPGAAPSEMRFDITVPPGRLWVMGDNRGDSDDSRMRTTSPGGGTIPESAVVGRAFLIIWPMSRINDIPIPNTFEQPALTAAAAVTTAPPIAMAGSIGFAGAGLLAGRRRLIARRRRRRTADAASVQGD